MTNKIFTDPTTTVPRNDPQFVRVPFEGSEIGGRQDHIPKKAPNPQLGVRHVSSKG